MDRDTEDTTELSLILGQGNVAALSNCHVQYASLLAAECSVFVGADHITNKVSLYMDKRFIYNISHRCSLSVR